MVTGFSGVIARVTADWLGGHGGVALLIRDTQRVELLPTPVTGAQSSNVEVLWAKVILEKWRVMLFASVYRVPKNISA